MSLFKAKDAGLVQDSFHEAVLELPREDDGIEKPEAQARENKWFASFKHVFPIYFAVSLATLMVSLVAVFSSNDYYTGKHTSPATLWNMWGTWDPTYYLYIATHGYSDSTSTAFFPLYPLLIKSVFSLHLFHNAILAGLLVSNIAVLGFLIVLYQLVKEDFDTSIADRTLFFMLAFPTACYLVAVYTESTFLFLSILSFYHIRRGQWWLAGGVGLFACLTRSTGVFLLIPFCYEYLRQRQFNLKKLRFNVLSMSLLPLGIGIFALYCYSRYGDPLSFSHAEALWGRKLVPPWVSINMSIHFIVQGQYTLGAPGWLDFRRSRALLNLVPDLLFFVLIILTFVGPWRFPRSYWAYSFYALVIFVFINMVPISLNNGFSDPLDSIFRYLLVLFPVFIFLARWGKNRLFYFTYLFLSVPLLLYGFITLLHGGWFE